MKIVKRLFMFCYMLTAVVAGIAFFGKNIGNSAIKEAVIYKAISSKIEDVIVESYPEVTSEQITAIYDDINENEFLNDITETYIKAIEETVAEDGSKGDVANHIDAAHVEDSIYNLSTDIIKLVTDTANINMGTMQKAIIQSVIKYMAQSIQSKITESCNNVVSYITPGIMAVVKIYIALTSLAARIISSILLAVFTILIVFMNSVRIRAIFDIGISILCGGVITMVLAFAAKSISLSLTEQLLGRAITLRAAPLLVYALVLIGVGAVLIGVWSVVVRKR